MVYGRGVWMFAIFGKDILCQVITSQCNFLSLALAL